MPRRARHGLAGPPREELPKPSGTLREGRYYVFAIVRLIFALRATKRESHAPFCATARILRGRRGAASQARP